jgi:VanZ family protein
MAAIFVVSSLSDPGTPPGGISYGTMHVLEYAVLGALMLRALARATWAGVTVSTTLLAFLLSVAYAATDELHQSFVPGRAAELLDLASDAAGAAAAAAMTWAWGIIRPNSPAGRPPHAPHPPR